MAVNWDKFSNKAAAAADDDDRSYLAGEWPENTYVHTSSMHAWQTSRNVLLNSRLESTGKRKLILSFFLSFFICQTLSMTNSKNANRCDREKGRGNFKEEEEEEEEEEEARSGNVLLLQ